MGTNLNFKSFGNEQPSEGSGAARPSLNFSLVRQPSVYSLTFEEFQNSVGKEFGSMNMDELLKNIWTAEETQNMVSAATATGVGGCQDGVNQGGHLQRQGSLTLPRTLSQKTVDEVWRNISITGSEASLPQGAQRQPTLGEITLEEFLVRAGVVREDARNVAKPNSNTEPSGFLGDLVRANNNNSSFGIDFQQPNRGLGLMGSHLVDDSASISLQSTNLPVNANGARTSQQQPIAAQMSQQQKQLHQQPIFPKQSAVSYAPNLAMPGNTQHGSPRIKGSILAHSTINGNLAQGSPLQSGGMGIVGLGAGAMSVTAGSPATLSSDGLAKSNGDTSSVSPVPYMFNGGLRGKRSNNGFEKVIERRQRRMIKNRESAARSRQRKQAYTMELEQEVAKLKEENEELRLKQEQIMEMQKNEALEMMNAKNGSKKCLRRTLTSPW